MGDLKTDFSTTQQVNSENRIFEIREPIDPLEETWGHKPLLKCERSADSRTEFRFFLSDALQNVIVTYFW